MTKKKWVKTGDKTPNYYRSSVSVNDFRLAMSGLGWLSLTQVSGLMREKIPPETRARWATLGKNHITHPSLAQRAEYGVRRMVQMKLGNFVRAGKVQKDGIGKDAKFRWIETENDTTIEDST